MREQSATLRLDRDLNGSGSILRFSLHNLIFRSICVLLFVFVFEEALLGRMSLSPAQYLAAKTASEVFLYALLLGVVANRIYLASILRYELTWFDLLVGSFLIGAIAATAAARDSSVVVGLVDLRTMLRYLAIFYVILLARWLPTPRQYRILARLIVALAIIQAVLVVIQHLAGDGFRDAYFGAQEQPVAIAGFGTVLGAMDAKLGAGFGTFGKTPLLAFFLLAGAVVAVTFALSSPSRDRSRWWGAYLVMLIGIYFSYKRAPLILALAVPYIVAGLMRQWRRLGSFLLLGGLLAPLALVALIMVRPDSYLKEKQVAVTPAESIAQLLSMDYWRIATLKARGWVIVQVGGDALTSLKPLGYGADEEAAKTELAGKGGGFSKLVGWGALDDVYVVAGLVYYGPVGMLLLITMFATLFRWSRRVARIPEIHLRRAANVLAAMLVLMLPAAFVVRILEFRGFAFLLWVMAGIVVSATLIGSRRKALASRAHTMHLATEGRS